MNTLISELSSEQLNEKYGFKSLYKNINDLNNNKFIDKGIYGILLENHIKTGKEMYELFFEMGFKPAVCFWNYDLIINDIITELKHNNESINDHNIVMKVNKIFKGNIDYHNLCTKLKNYEEQYELN